MIVVTTLILIMVIIVILDFVIGCYCDKIEIDEIKNNDGKNIDD